jgi:hypothetical protein
MAAHAISFILAEVLLNVLQHGAMYLYVVYMYMPTFQSNMLAGDLPGGKW